MKEIFDKWCTDSVVFVLIVFISPNTLTINGVEIKLYNSAIQF